MDNGELLTPNVSPDNVRLSPLSIFNYPLRFCDLFFLPITNIQRGHGINLRAVHHVGNADTTAHARGRIPLFASFGLRRIDQMGAASPTRGDRGHTLCRDSCTVAGDAATDRP